MNKYEQQAVDFLTATGTTLAIEYQYNGPYFAGEKDSRDVYLVTIINSKGEYSFTFGDSLNNTNLRQSACNATINSFHPFRTYKAALAAREQKPFAYDVLSCLEKHDPDTFENWIDEMGYSDSPLKEYPRILQIWQECVNQYHALSRMFTPSEMEALQEIN